MGKRGKKMDQENKTPLSSFFRFKNYQTEVEILKILNTHEGVLEDQAEKYLNFSHQIIKAELFIETKDVIRKFWIKHKELPFSDVIGLFDMALTDMKYNMIKKGDNFVKELRRRQQ